MMNVLLLGLGSWGRRWLDALRTHPAIRVIAVVDPSPDARAEAERQGVRWFADVADALANGKPDFAVNASPPAMHTPTNRLLIAAGVPVLCEKPIAPSLEEALAVVTEAANAGVPFVIAENHRRGGLPRAARDLVATGKIGPVLAVHCTLYRNYDEPKPYLVAQEFPLLEDVAIHYVDLALAFAGARPSRVHAAGFHPGGGIFQGSPGMALTVGFANGVIFTFSGNLASRGRSTSWMGEWRVEGRDGSTEFDEGPLRVHVGDSSRTMPPAADGSVLDDFLDQLRTGESTETSGRDYLPAQAIIAAGVLSARHGHAVEILEDLTLKPITP